MNREVTLLLGDLGGGDRSAASKLLPIVYAELRSVAAAQLARQRPGQTLQATALVHEAYMKLVGEADPGWNGRGHFFGAAAQAMREILVDHLRHKMAAKRGGGRDNVELEVGFGIAAEGLPTDDVLAIHAGIEVLEVDHPRRAEIVVMHYFGGLTVPEIAESLGTTTRTIERDLRFSRAFLSEQLAASSP